MPAHKIPLEVRFWQKVDKTPTCWLWTGATTGDGYGHIKIDRRMVRAHRVSYELNGGTVPEGLVLDHLCRVRNCVNPEHLEPVTRAVNTLRGETITAHYASRTRCKNGHEYTPESTYLHGTHRHCRTCRAERAA